MEQSNEIVGYLDSVETMGLVDGPGIRFVAFMKGCKLRCLYCHNPETWCNMNDSLKVTSEELLKRINKYHNYYVNGGITFSGGEPLLQTEFIIDILKKCKMINLHTALDTAGCGNGSYEEILKYTDLVILDIKSYEPEMYKKITGQDMTEFNKFLYTCQYLNKKLWIRSVIVPGINDTPEYIEGLNKYLENIKNIEKVELLPYHLYGVAKYEKLGIKYSLEGVPPLSNAKLDELNKYLKK